MSAVGDQELSRKEDELRVYEIESRDIQRSIDVTRPMLDQIQKLDVEVALLQKNLLEARRTSESLSLALESPENASR